MTAASLAETRRRLDAGDTSSVDLVSAALARAQACAHLAAVVGVRAGAAIAVVELAQRRADRFRENIAAGAHDEVNEREAHARPAVEIQIRGAQHASISHNSPCTMRDRCRPTCLEGLSFMNGISFFVATHWLITCASTFVTTAAIRSALPHGKPPAASSSSVAAPRYVP